MLNFKLFIVKIQICSLKGLLICLGGLAVNYSYIIYGDLKKIDKVYGGEPLPIGPLCASMWYIGACFGSIICGCSRYTWSAQMTHVRFLYYYLISVQ